jgi:molybdopterin-synthase adenylyltransferase
MLDGQKAKPAAASSDAARLRTCSVLIVGVGALGSPAALALAEAGVGRLILLDPDTVEISNLHRQILHCDASLGEAKVESARRRLAELYPDTDVVARIDRLEQNNLQRHFSGVDFVIDATDGAEAKYLLNDGAVRRGLPLSHAGVVGFVGQTLTVLPGASACLRCLFPEPPADEQVSTCREAGIIGPLAGVIGAVQAQEAIRVLNGEQARLADRILTFDALSLRWRRIALSRNPSCPLCRQPTATVLDEPSPARYGSGHT